eukprot:5079037-Pleurochrysis_carterae.AAC.1
MSTPLCTASANHARAQTAGAAYYALRCHRQRGASVCRACLPASNDVSIESCISSSTLICADSKARRSSSGVSRAPARGPEERTHTDECSAAAPLARV